MKTRHLSMKSSFARNCGAVLAVTALAVTSASAQATNAGISAISDAIDGLKPDMGTIVLSAIGLALVGIGAVIALSLGKKIMGKG